jgi:hypothetical protein
MVTLPNSTLPWKETIKVAINSNRERRSFHTKHHQMDKPLRETQQIKKISEKWPLH